MKVTRFAHIHNLKEQETSQLNGFYPNFYSHLEQVNGFHLYTCKHTTLCMRDECYQCDKVCPYTQPEGTGNNSFEWLLPELLFTLRAGEWFLTRFSQIHNLKEP